MLEAKIFKSKIGWLMMLFLVATIGGSIVVTSYIKAWPAVVVSSIAAMYIIHMYLNTRYSIIGGTLQIKCGIWINTKIAIASIRSVNHSNSVLSAPALSMDRLLIKYNRYDEILISPENNEEFMLYLKELNPAIEF